MDGKWCHRCGEGEEIGGSIGILGGFSGAPSVTYGLLVVSDGERDAVKEGVGEDSRTHAGGGVVVVRRVGWIWNADASRFYGEG